MEKLGIKETKELVDAVHTAIKAGKTALADGKIDIQDLGQILVLIPAIQSAVDGAKEIPSELKDLDSAEAAELVTHVMTGLAIDDAKAREVIEKSLKVAVAAYELVKAL